MRLAILKYPESFFGVANVGLFLLRNDRFLLNS